MKQVVSVENMRKSDSYTIENKTPSRELMHRAGAGVYTSVPWQVILEEKEGKSGIAVVCGAGNNGGDGYVIAALLCQNGYDCTVIAIDGKMTEDTAYYQAKCKELGMKICSYKESTELDYAIIVDCIFGTGFRGEARGEARDAIEKINRSGAYVVSVDINSGLNGDSGLGTTFVKSDLTVSIGILKTGHFLNMAKDTRARVINCDIGIEPIEKPYLLFEEADVKKYIPKRQSYSHKGTYGYIALIGGSPQYIGAIKLGALSSAAMRSGSGVVKIVSSRSICQSLMPGITEATLFPLSENEGYIKFNEEEIQKALSGVKAVAVGMGMGRSGDNGALIEYILKSYSLPVLIDADGLAYITKEMIRESKCRVVLTPHLKEFERLSGVPVGEIEKDIINHARSYARQSGAIVLLKGPTTVITDGEDVYLSSTGAPSMASAGSGDVLSGVICSLLGNSTIGGSVLERVALGAFINGYAGELACNELGECSALASDTAMHIAKAIKKLFE